MTEEIYNKYKGMVWNIAHKVCPTKKKYDVEDYFQEGFAEICRRIHQYDSNRAKMSTFIYHIAKNKMMRKRHKDGKRNEVSLSELKRYQWEKSYEDNEEKSFEYNLTNISERLFNLRMSGYTVEEIMAITGDSRNKIQKIINHAMRVKVEKSLSN